MKKERIVEILKENSVNSEDDRLIYESDVEYFVNELHREFEADKQELVEALKKHLKITSYGDFLRSRGIAKKILEKHTGKPIEELLK